MQILINISEKEYNLIKNCAKWHELNIPEEAILQGVIIPPDTSEYEDTLSVEERIKNRLAKSVDEDIWMHSSAGIRELAKEIIRGMMAESEEI